jgi:hypothetical protein
VPGRMERIEAGQPFVVVVDYAHTADALAKVLDELAPVAAARGGALIAVFGSAGERVGWRRSRAGSPRALPPGDSPLTRILVARTPRPSWSRSRWAEATPARRGHDLLLAADRDAAIRRGIRAGPPGDVVLLARGPRADPGAPAASWRGTSGPLPSGSPSAGSRPSRPAGLTQPGATDRPRTTSGSAAAAHHGSLRPRHGPAILGGPMSSSSSPPLPLRVGRTAGRAPPARLPVMGTGRRSLRPPVRRELLERWPSTSPGADAETVARADSPSLPTRASASHRRALRDPSHRGGASPWPSGARHDRHRRAPARRARGHRVQPGGRRGALRSRGRAPRRRRHQAVQVQHPQPRAAAGREHPEDVPGHGRRHPES